VKAIGDPVFPHVSPEAGHYESFFANGRHPSEPLAFWLRHTVHQRPGEPPTASLWLTLFDHDEVMAGKQTFREPSVPDGGYIAVGPAVLTPSGGRGALESHTLDARWSFEFTGADAEQRHLPAAWMYDAPLPRTKSGTPHPGVTFSGRVGPCRVDGWRGLVSHNWGSQHAERWIWMHAALDDGVTGEGDGWLELVLGRIRLGRWTTPWIANGALQLGGRRHRLGGVDRARATKVDERPTGARFVVTGDGIRLEAELAAPPSRFVCWRYADPDGPEHHSAHSSLVDLRAEVRRAGAPRLVIEAPATASYELGMRETDHGLPVQPYDDGRL
jgi:hypothetical protein